MVTSESTGIASEFVYLIEKIQSVEVRDTPFEHIYIEDFLHDNHFSTVSQSNQINLPQFRSDENLIDGLMNKGYEPIGFPGTTENIEDYLSWREGGKEHTNSDTTEGYGMTFRLQQFEDPILQDFADLFSSSEFFSVLCDKFGIDSRGTNIDSGLQKYLDGYEISPHPDVRRKALTFMLNINPAEDSEELNYHTHYMNFRDEYKYVERFWEHNEQYDRCWVPWDWCETHNQQTQNNSIVIFSPSDDTIHAVKASYDHLKTQRTQFYGNLWYEDDKTDSTPSWQQLEIPAHNQESINSKLKQSVRNRLVGLKSVIRAFT